MVAFFIHWIGLVWRFKRHASRFFQNLETREFLLPVRQFALVTHSDYRAPVQADLDVGLQLLRCLFSSCHKRSNFVLL